MVRNYLNRIRYWLESIAFAGLPAQILTFTAIILLTSLFFGGLLFILTDDFQGLEGLLEAIWWAFLRLSDPGYLGDDQGFIKRSISTVLTVLGYVLFLGSFIALITQYMFRSLREMENGTTPLFLQDHILILGLNSSTAILVEGILKSNVHRKDFSKRTDVHDINIVILCEELDAQIFYRFKQSLGELWGTNIHLRGGSPLKLEDLNRVNFLKASSIIVPSIEGEGIDSDARNIKTLLSIISASPNIEEDEEIPPIVVEMISRKKANIARNLTSRNVEVICRDTLLSRIIAQNVRHTGLAQVYSELLRRHYGNSIFVRFYPELVSKSCGLARQSFSRAIMLGILKKIGHRHVPLLNPTPETIIGMDDQIVLIGSNMGDLTCTITEEESLTNIHKTSPQISLPKVKRKVLILGWNQQASSVIQTFSGYKNEIFEIVNISRVPVSERKKKLSKLEFEPGNIQIELIHGDHNSPSKIKSIQPETFTDIIMLSTEHPQSDQDIDARIILGQLILNDHLRSFSHRPDILVEVLDHQNEKLFIKNKDEVFVAPLIITHMLSQVALKPEINEIYEDLLDTTEHEISITPAVNFECANKTMLIEDLKMNINQTGVIFLGYIKVLKRGKTYREYFLNPPDDQVINFNEYDEIIFLK